jgi:hypothetical protein
MMDDGRCSTLEIINESYNPGMKHAQDCRIKTWGC